MSAFDKNFKPKEAPPKDQGAESKFERHKRNFQNRLKAIKQKELSTENIDSFADDVLSELIELADDVTDAYARSEGIEKENTKEFEKDAFRYFDLTDLSKVLELAHKKTESLQRVDSKIANTPKIDTIITPPETEDPTLEPGKEDYEEPQKEPRLKTLLYILKNNGIDVEQGVDTLKGKITDEMMRNTSYVTVSIPGIDRVVQVCDEVGNASYVFKLSAVDIERINDMTKSEKNELLEANPEIGTRIEHRDGWRQAMRQLLFTDELERADSESQQEGGGSSSQFDQEVPNVATGELDEWQGFYSNEEGNHYGTVTNIARKLDVSRYIVNKHADDVTSMKVIDQSGKERVAYCFEEVADRLEERSSLPQVEKGGQWKGFHVDEEGNHYGPLTKIAERLDVTIRMVENNANEVSTMEVLDGASRETKAYCFEEVKSNIDEYLSLPKVEGEGEWEGFYIDEDGKHYGLLTKVSEKLNISSNLLNEHTDAISTIEVLDSLNRKEKAYCLEETKEYFSDRLTLPQVEKEGEWEGFYIDEEGDHYGPVSIIAKKLNTSETMIQNNIDQISSIQVVGLNGRESTAYCFEEIEGRVGRLLSLPQVRQEGEWEGFYESDDGYHYAPVSRIADELDASRKTIKRRSDEISKMQVRGSQGVEREALCFEEVKEEIGKLESLPDVNKEGEWAWFYEGKDENHYGPLANIAKKLGISEPKVRERADKVSSMSVRGVGGRKLEAYSFEEMKKQFSELLSLPQVEKEGEWEGFYINEEGNHYGLIGKVADKLNISSDTVKKYSDQVSTIQVLDSRNRKGTAYCYEELKRLL